MEYPLQILELTFRDKCIQQAQVTWMEVITVMHKMNRVLRRGTLTLRYVQGLY